MHTEFNAIIENLTSIGYAICEDFLPQNEVHALAEIALQHYANGEMAAAKVGKSNNNASLNIRGDSTLWLEENEANPAVQAYLCHMYALKHALNQRLFMGLQSFETHFAVYPVGASYQKHLDQFRGANNTRLISSILYLNEAWQAQDGGELRLYLEDDKCLDILPTGGKLVLFLSEQFWHEVLPAKRVRTSLTGWFRAREILAI